MSSLLKPFDKGNLGDDDQSPEDDDDSPQRKGSRSRSKNSKGQHGTCKGKDAMGFEPQTKDSTWIHKSDNDSSFPLTPSTKTIALKAILLRAFAEAPLDKVSCLLHSFVRT